VFLDSVVQYKETAEPTQRFNFLTVLVSSYIKAGSPSELNIGSEVREQIVCEFVKALSSSQPCSITIFDKLADELTLQLQKEQFPRFLQSPYYTMCIQGESLHETVATAESPSADDQNPIANDLVDFSRQSEVTDEDFEKLERLAAHDPAVWTPIAKKKHTHAYVSMSKYKMSGSKSELRMCKFVSEFECSAVDLMNTLLSQELRPKHERTYLTSKCFDYIKRDDTHPYAIAVVLEQHKLGFPLSNRDFILSCSVKYDAQRKRYIVLRKSCEHPMAPVMLKKGNVRAFGYGGFIFEEISAKSSRYYHIAYVDLRGMFPAKLYNYAVKLQGTEGYDSGLKLVKQQAKKGFPAPFDTDKLFQTLAENSMAYSPSMRRRSTNSSVQQIVI